MRIFSLSALLSAKEKPYSGPMCGRSPRSEWPPTPKPMDASPNVPSARLAGQPRGQFGVAGALPFSLNQIFTSGRTVQLLAALSQHCANSAAVRGSVSW